MISNVEVIFNYPTSFFVKSQILSKKNFKNFGGKLKLKEIFTVFF